MAEVVTLILAVLFIVYELGSRLKRVWLRARGPIGPEPRPIGSKLFSLRYLQLEA